jgi:hypothetical protein
VRRRGGMPRRCWEGLSFRGVAVPGLPTGIARGLTLLRVTLPGLRRAVEGGQWRIALGKRIDSLSLC